MLAAAGDHRNCALKFRLSDRPIPLEEAAARFDPAYGVFETVPAREVATASGTARVLERHACIYAGLRFAHVVLRYHGVVVSLVATRAPAESPGKRLAAAPALVESRVDGIGVVTFQASGHIVCIVGDLPAADLASLAGALSGEIAQQLAGM